MKIRRQSVFASFLVTAVLTACACANISSVDALSTIDIRQVKVGGEIGRRIDVTINNNLLALNVYKLFVQPFKQRVEGEGDKYIGTGKLIDAVVRLAAYTQDERLLELKKHLVEGIIKTQEPDGYIGGLPAEVRMWKLWDIHEMGYVILGLCSDYEYFGRTESLEAAERLGDYIIRRWSAEPDRTLTKDFSAYVATTGIEQAFMILYEQRRRQRYLDFCVEHRRLGQWNAPIVVGRYDNLEQHAYYHMCRCLAQLRLYRVRPSAELLETTRRTMDFLTRADGLVITGTCGYHECWHDNQQGFFKLAETCATAYLLRFNDRLLRMEGLSKYGDIMERTIYNGLFAAQSPDGRRIRYYTPFEGERVYFKPDTYCCPGNYRRIISQLPEMIYYTAENTLAVNLYTPGAAKVRLADDLVVDIRQETDYPNSGKVLIHISPSKSARFQLRLRIPGWCDKARVTINGKGVEETIEKGSFFTIKRQWRAGDTVELQMGMGWRWVKGRKAQAGRAALMRGPILFCLNRLRQQEKLDPADLKVIRLDPETLSAPYKDDTVRPNGMAVDVRAWKRYGDPVIKAADLKLVLTEFADPNGQAAYFLVPNPNAPIFIDDELLEPQPAR